VSKQDPNSGGHSFRNTILATIVGGVMATGGGILGQYFASQFQISSQAQIQKVKDQRQVFARLMGRRFSTMQLYVSRSEALMYSDYHEARWKHFGSPNNSIDLSEAQRWMHRSEDLVFEIARNNQALFEDLGVIRAVFPDTPQLRKLVERIYSFKSIKTAQPPHNGSVEELQRWKEEAIPHLQLFVERNYGDPISELLSYLSEQLPAD
jgi:hypothetical protein